ncbi:MAG: citrate lyase acyl carrier protein [Calditrichaeota bacterium]|nr:citrate lyase acyl carrier protein [Calditrichota bacterium]
MPKTAIAGNRGEEIRSDCFVSLEMKTAGGIEIELNSRVKSIFGRTIIERCREVLHFFSVKNARVYIEDSGALDFVLTARIEAAVLQLVETGKSYRPEVLPQNRYHIEKDRLRRSRLYLPGNTPKLMLNAGIHLPDGIILDLEDSVAPDRKAEARMLVRNALCRVDFYGAERMVRINQLPAGLEDLDVVVPCHVNLVLLPKCESAGQVRQVAERIDTILAQHQLAYPVYLMPIIESALGVVNAYAIAAASEKVAALAIGLEDYTADIGARRTAEGRESFFARSQVVNAARAAGVQPIDSVFSDVDNLDALQTSARESKALGFDGMGCIHPRQIRVIHAAFSPDDAEIKQAWQIVLAFEEAGRLGLGVVALGSKMIDPPVVKRAQQILDLAVRLGKLDKDWRQHGGE